MLKQKINSDFIEAYKGHNLFKKTVLGMLKTKITEAEKKEGKELTDSEVISVVSSAVKQVEQSIEAFKQSPDKVAEATLEKEILSEYLPAQMTEAEIKAEVLLILEDMIFPPEQAKRAMGGIMSHFKTNYNGKYNPAVLKAIIDETFA